MPLIGKTLIRTGLYEAPQGKLRVDRGRLNRWADNFQQMKREGILVPCSWGHQADALPGDRRDRASQQFWLSRYNAGYLKDLTVTPDGKLDGKLDCPGVELDGDKLTAWVKLPDGRQVRTAIGEVSLAIKDWKDGTGKTWQDSIVHLAITPLPVAHGTGGFRAALSGAVCTDSDQLITLSLNYRLSTGEDDMAEEKEEDDRDMESDVESEADETETDLFGEGDTEAPPAPSEDGVSDTAGLQRGDSSYFAKGMEILASNGIPLPPDTTPENFWERLCVAGHVLENTDAGVEPLDAEPGMDDSMMGDGMSDPMMADGAGDMPMDAEAEAGMPPEEPGETYTGEEDEEGDDVEEQRPVMMSLTTTKDPKTRRLLAREQKRHKSNLLTRIERLEKRGLPKAKTDELRKQLEGYTLSLTDDDECRVIPKRLDERIADFELSLASAPPAGKIPGGRVARRPDIRQNDGEDRKRQEQIGVELAERAGYTVASK